MISAIPALLIFVLITISLTLWQARASDRRFMSLLMLGGWLLLGSLTTIVDYWMPFAGGGDDERYYQLATVAVSSWTDLLDPLIFQGQMEQAGYPWLLAAINLSFSPGVLGLKFFNVFLLLLTALVWYRIGGALNDGSFGRWLSAGTVFLTPLWFYAFFILKDLAIVLIQSLFLLGLVRTWRGGPLRAWLLTGASAFALLPLRSPLLLQDMGVAIGAVTARLMAPGRIWRRLIVLVVGLPAMGALLLVASDPVWMMSLGIYSESRVVGSSAMLEMGEQHGEASSMQRSLFPLLYIFSETAGLNADSWVIRDAQWLRGVLALPWIAFIPPALLLGLLRLAGSEPESVTRRAGGPWRRFVASRAFATPWAAVLGFIAASMFVSWVVGDTTRWRLADMPAINAVAIGAWRFLPRRRCANWLVLWVALAGAAFSGYYLLRAW